MAFRAKRSHEIKKRILSLKFEHKRKLWLSLVHNQLLPISVRFYFYKKLRRTRRVAFNRLKNRCIFSNRTYSVLRFFRMSRIVFRIHARAGLLTGVQRASW
jgi:ribosomal protein S14